MLKASLLILTGWCLSLAVNAAAFDHGDWNQLLRQHVVSQRDGLTTAVDYQAMNGDRNRLKKYLQSLEKVNLSEFELWSKPDQLAFLINAYNAWTIELVLTGYPKIQSIKELGSFFRSPWKKTFIPLLGKIRSLDDIEHGMIREAGRYNDPRIHFAVNCASIGCPALRTEAYSGERLELQLQEQTERFLSDRTRNRYIDNQLEVSSLFKWYREDFERGWQGFHSLKAFFANFATQLGLTDADIQRLRAGEIGIEILDYDWQLNAIPEQL
ncbi:MAG: DUF547 domain-containing protein [Candidatus Thiodiazotropha sp. (ex Codakia rugifera)]|nr:DUF547 domain-containing protein [Candidatus Thiodiazotropha sp. (ex Codakia rugifera)]